MKEDEEEDRLCGPPSAEPGVVTCVSEGPAQPQGQVPRGPAAPLGQPRTDPSAGGSGTAVMCGQTPAR